MRNLFYHTLAQLFQWLAGKPDSIFEIIPEYPHRVFYISPSGNDNNDGLTVSTPLKTLNGLLDQPNTTVYFVPGDYKWSDLGFHLTVDSGYEPETNPNDSQG